MVAQSSVIVYVLGPQARVSPVAVSIESCGEVKVAVALEYSFTEIEVGAVITSGIVTARQLFTMVTVAVTCVAATVSAVWP